MFEENTTQVKVIHMKASTQAAARTIILRPDHALMEYSLSDWKPYH